METLAGSLISLGVAILLGVVVLFDARKLERRGARLSPWLWAVGVVLLAIVFGPLYLLLRFTVWKRQLVPAFESDPEPGWGSLGGALLLLLAGELVVMLALAAMGLGLPEAGGTAAYSRPEILAVALATLASQPAMVGVSWLILCYRRRRSIAEGLRLRPINRRQLAGAVGVAVAMAAGGLLLSLVNGASSAELMRLVSIREGFLVLTVMALIAPFGEELLFRGLVFSIFAHKVGRVAAVMASTFSFMLVHMPQLAGDGISLATITAVGLVLGIQRARSRNLTGPIITHLAYNAFLVTSAWAAVLLGFEQLG